LLEEDIAAHGERINDLTTQTLGMPRYRSVACVTKVVQLSVEYVNMFH